MGRGSEDEHSTEELVLHFNSSVHTQSHIQLTSSNAHRRHINVTMEQQAQQQQVQRRWQQGKE